ITSIPDTFTGDVFFKSGRPWADVRAYGAKGDDSTDDSGASNNAITALSALGGGILYFPPGKYRFTSSVIPASNITILGAGPGNTIIKPVGLIQAFYFNGSAGN